MSDILGLIRTKLANNENATSEELVRILKEIEALLSERSSGIPGHTAKQVEELLFPLRERVKKAKVKRAGFSFKDVSLDPPVIPQRPSEAFDPSAQPRKEENDATVPLHLSKETNSSEKDVVYQGLEGETILICLPLKALTLIGLKRCRVFSLSSIESSLMVRDCSGCEFHIRANQLRIHSTIDCRFNVFCSTDPIIEKSSSLVFAECRLVASEAEAASHPEWALAEANKFKNVRDFNWLKPQASPNFTLDINTSRDALVVHGETIRFY